MSSGSMQMTDAKMRGREVDGSLEVLNLDLEQVSLPLLMYTPLCTGISNYLSVYMVTFENYFCLNWYKIRADASEIFLMLHLKLS